MTLTGDGTPVDGSAVPGDADEGDSTAALNAELREIPAETRRGHRGGPAA